MSQENAESPTTRNQKAESSTKSQTHTRHQHQVTAHEEYETQRTAPEPCRYTDTVPPARIVAEAAGAARATPLALPGLGAQLAAASFFLVAFFLVFFLPLFLLGGSSYGSTCRSRKSLSCATALVSASFVRSA